MGRDQGNQGNRGSSGGSRGSQGGSGGRSSGRGRGFAAMDDAQQRRIARKGGQASARVQVRDEQGQFAGTRGGRSGGGSGGSRGGGGGNR